MARRIAGRDQHGVEAHIVHRRIGIGRKIGLGRRDDALALPFGHRLRRLVEIVARLHFDEEQEMPASRDDVDLADRTLPAPRQDFEAFRDQQRGRAAFGGNAGLEGDLPFRVGFRLGRALARASGRRPGALNLLSAIAVLFRKLERALIDVAARPSGH